ncbi:MAG: DUF861 domain-containing protein [Hyphomicrobiales bacterium]|nr:DUF861 domain-containing protein [Hyphomicrobiales bacterium]MDE2115022.1 DUF861 domain-containing protein [Hyphomicrobiales bacterium]
MSKPAIVFPNQFNCKPSPINPQWIISGTPEARSVVLATSADGLATTVIWECDPGSFNWYYDFDETVHFIEGSVTIRDAVGQTKTLGAGDIVVFPAGSHAIWTVHSRVRKVAVFKRVLPRQLGAVIAILRAVKRVIKGTKAPASGALAPV